MAGVTTAIVGFILVCIAWPHLVKHRTQFYAALGAALLIILLDSIAAMVYRGTEGSGGFRAFAYAMIGLLQIVALLALFFSCGGVTPREVAGEMKRAIEVIRRGEEEKEIIIPLSGQKKPPPREDQEEDEGHVVYEINDTDHPKTPPAAPPPARTPPDRGSLPLG